MKNIIEDIMLDWKYYGVIALIVIVIFLPAIIFEPYFVILTKVIRAFIFLEGAWFVYVELAATDPFPVEWYRSPILKGLSMQVFAVFIFPRLMAWSATL